MYPRAFPLALPWTHVPAELLYGLVVVYIATDNYCMDLVIVYIATDNSIMALGMEVLMIFPLPIRLPWFTYLAKNIFP